jgi:hypothetical protein
MPALLCLAETGSACPAEPGLAETSIAEPVLANSALLRSFIMTERRRIYKDSDGVRRTMIWDDEDPNQVTVHTQQDVESILESCAARRDNHDPRKANWGVGQVPVAIWEKACNEQWDESDWRRWWNGEGRPFRTSPGWV